MAFIRSSFKPKPQSAPHHSRHSQRLDRRAPDRVSFVKQVLRGDERFDEAVERACGRVLHMAFAKGDQLRFGACADFHRLMIARDSLTSATT